jgi:hypothetical protein
VGWLMVGVAPAYGPTHPQPLPFQGGEDIAPQTQNADIRGDVGVRRYLSGEDQAFMWPARCLFISNIVTLSLPKTFFSFSSATISRLFSGFWRLCALI